MRRKVFFGLIVLSAAAFRIEASPLFGVGDCPGCTPWQDALAPGGPIRPGENITNSYLQDGLTQVERAFFDDTGETYGYSQPQLYAVDSVPDRNNQMQDALVMRWDNLPGTDLRVAAWEYVYDLDPDLTGTRIEFSLLFPPPIWDFSIELVDSMGQLGAGSSIRPVSPPDTWNTFLLDPSLLGQPGFLFGFEDVGFDLTQVVLIRLDEAGMTSAMFPPPPGGVMPGQWNAWNHLRVVPEPGTLLLFSMGFAAWGVTRRRVSNQS